jgi:hypothetical protein
MGTHTSESSREGRPKGTGNMCGKTREKLMRGNGIKGESMAMVSGLGLMVTHTLDSGRTALHTGLECRLHLMETGTKGSGTTQLNMEKGLKCTRMVMFISETTERVYLTALESTFGLTRATLRELLLTV